MDEARTSWYKAKEWLRNSNLNKPANTQMGEQNILFFHSDAKKPDELCNKTHEQRLLTGKKSSTLK